MMTMTLKKLIIVSTYLCIVHLVIHRFYSISMIWSSRKLKRKHISEQRKFGFLEPQKVQKLTFKWADIPPPVHHNWKFSTSRKFEFWKIATQSSHGSLFSLRCCKWLSKRANGWESEREIKKMKRAFSHFSFHK